MTVPGTDRAMWYQLFQLDHQSGQSLQSQLRECLVKAILDHRIALDKPLPSSRELARQLRVARNTVVLAYQHLIDENYLIARERRGYFVNPDMLTGRVAATRPETAAPAAASDTPPAVVHDLLAQRNIERPLDWQRFDYPFIYGQVDTTLFPVNDWREASRMSLRVDAISRWTHDKVDHDDELLVEQLLTRVLPRRGVWVDADQVLITTGAQNAIFLCAQLLLDQQATVGMEDPCYVDARNIFSLFTRRQIGFPVGENGVQTDARLAQCKLMYVTPSHQCPTTTTMPLAERLKLLEQARENDVLLLEDDYESELNFTGEPSPALKSLDQHQRVIYLGSLSKTLAPGLRLGFLVGPREFISQARALRRLMYRHPPTNNQRTVAHFLALGHHDSALLRLSQAFRRRWQIMDEALARHPQLSAAAPGFGGTSFWVRLPDRVAAADLEKRAAREGILINAGDNYFRNAQGCCNFCRMGFSSIAEDRIEPGVAKLAALITELSAD